MRDLNGIKIITGAELAVVLADDTQLTIDSEHISLNGIVLDDSTSVDGQFTIGAAVTGQLTITILNEDELYSPYNFRDATCQLTLLGVDEIHALRIVRRVHHTSLCRTELDEWIQ